MFVEVVDVFGVTTTINTNAIAHVQSSIKKSQEDPTQLEFRRAIVTFSDQSQRIFLDEVNYNILKQALIQS